MDPPHPSLHQICHLICKGRSLHDGSFSNKKTQWCIPCWLFFFWMLYYTVSIPDLFSFSSSLLSFLLEESTNFWHTSRADKGCSRVLQWVWTLISNRKPPLLQRIGVVFIKGDACHLLKLNQEAFIDFPQSILRSSVHLDGSFGLISWSQAEGRWIMGGSC